MKVEYLGVNGLSSDIGICDAARVSFDKRAENYSEEQNTKLLKYLDDHKHWSPFGHAREAFMISMSDIDWLRFFFNANTAGFSWAPTMGYTPNHRLLSGSLWAWVQNSYTFSEHIRAQILSFLKGKYVLCPFWKDEKVDIDFFTDKLEGAAIHESLFDTEVPLSLRSAETACVSFRIQAPVFVARQLVKHQVDLCWNEESRRYISSEPSFWQPGAWRGKPENKKQGSDGFVENQIQIQSEFDAALNGCAEAYMTMLQEGVAPEMARSVLPLSMNTSWVWTGTVAAFARVAAERLAPNAQKETAEVVSKMDHFLKNDPMVQGIYHP